MAAPRAPLLPPAHQGSIAGGGIQVPAPWGHGGKQAELLVLLLGQKPKSKEKLWEGFLERDFAAPTQDGFLWRGCHISEPKTGLECCRAATLGAEQREQGREGKYHPLSTVPKPSWGLGDGWAPEGVHKGLGEGVDKGVSSCAVLCQTMAGSRVGSSGECMGTLPAWLPAAALGARPSPLWEN